MKKLSTLFTAMLLALATVSLTSCDDDDIANTLEGTWEGDMWVTSYYDNYAYDASYSELCFLRDPYRYSAGDGYWVDYYSNAPWDYHANHIEWEVNLGTITIYFVEDGGSVDIYDYDLDDNYFTGVIRATDGTGQMLNFSLRHISSPNWNNFYYGDYYSWAKQGQFDSAEATRANTSATETAKPKRIFCAR